MPPWHEYDVEWLKHRRKSVLVLAIDSKTFRMCESPKPIRMLPLP